MGYIEDNRIFAEKFKYLTNPPFLYFSEYEYDANSQAYGSNEIVCCERYHIVEVDIDAASYKNRQGYYEMRYIIADIANIGFEIKA
jgi:hypothetical protein